MTSFFLEIEDDLKFLIMEESNLFTNPGNERLQQGGMNKQLVLRDKSRQQRILEHERDLMRTMSDNKIEMQRGICSARQRDYRKTERWGSDQEIKQHVGWSDQGLNLSPEKLRRLSKGVTN